jgi:hypothetical protein
MPCTGDSITDEQLSRAAMLHFDSDWTWGMICQDLKCSPMTLRAARESDRWEEACKPWEVLRADLRRSAYKALQRQVDKGDTAAIKEALARTEGNVAIPVDTKLEIVVVEHAPASVPEATDLPPE